MFKLTDKKPITTFLSIIFVSYALYYWRNNSSRLAFKKSLEPSYGVFTVIKEELSQCFNIAFAETTLFGVPCASSSQYCFVLVNDLYIGDTLEANKYRKYAYSSKTLLINTLIGGRVNLLPSSMYNVLGHSTVFLNRSKYI